MYHIKSEKSFEFFRMNQDAKAALKGALERKQQIAELREATGEEDEHTLRLLVHTGIDADSVQLIHLAPLIEVAWADHEMQPKEAKLVLEIATLRGIKEGTKAHELLLRWLEHKPKDPVFDACHHVANSMLEHLPAAQREKTLKSIDECVHAVAEAAGGLFGVFGKVSDEEKALIDELATIYHHKLAKKSG